MLIFAAIFSITEHLVVMDSWSFAALNSYSPSFELKKGWVESLLFEFRSRSAVACRFGE